MLHTANFQSGAANQFNALLEVQPNTHVMATEFWSGWFDHWSQGYHDGSTVASMGPLHVQSINQLTFELYHTDFNNTLREILSFGGSVNFYMFHGGTNFGFMNGANNQYNFPYYLPDVTSYGQ